MENNFYKTKSNKMSVLENICNVRFATELGETGQCVLKTCYESMFLPACDSVNVGRMAAVHDRRCRSGNAAQEMTIAIRLEHCGK